MEEQTMNSGRFLTAVITGMLMQFVPDVFAQFQYRVNTKIEAEDLVRSGSGLRVSHGSGWVNHPSNFIYGICGNRHFLCDYRVIFECQYNCCDEYVSVPISIPATGEYIVYAYVANWADSAGIAANRGCSRTDKWECSAWFVAWDSPSALNKVKDVNGNDNVPKEYLWKTFPYSKYCGRFDLDTVSVGYDRTDIPGGDPREYGFPPTIFPLTAGNHTLFLKVAEEYTLLDWLYIAKVGDAPPAATPGRSWQATAIGGGNAESLQPAGFVLKQNHPNPFNPGTTIEYTLPRKAEVRITVYDITGRPICVLVNSTQEAGNYTVQFAGNNLASGTYVYRFEALCESCGGLKTFYKVEKKMTLLK